MKHLNIINSILLYVALTSLFFLPGGYFRVDQFIFFIFFFIAFLNGKLFENRDINWECLFFFLLMMTTSFGIFVKLFSTNKFIWRDFMTIFRDLFYFIVFLGVFHNFKNNPAKMKVIPFFIILSILCSSISFLQYFNIFGLNSYFVDIYRASDTWLLDMVSWRRVYGTIGNPNYWGFLLVQILIVLTYMLFWDGKIIVSPLILVTFTSLIFTGSRGALLSYILAFFLGFVVLIFLRKSKLKLIYFFFLIFITVPILIAIVKYSGYEGLDRFSLSNIESFYGRLQRWSGVLATTPLNLLIGAGPLKGAQVQWVDNTYLKILYEQGVTGLLCYLCLLLTFLFRLLKKIKYIQQPEKLRWTSISVILILNWMLFGLSADIWSHVRCAPIFLGLVAYTYASILRKEKESLNTE